MSKRKHKKITQRKEIFTCVKCKQGFTDGLVYRNGKLYQVCISCREKAYRRLYNDRHEQTIE